MPTLMLLMLVETQALAPCGLTLERPCYTRAVEAHEAAPVVSVPSAAEQELAICKLALTEQKDGFHHFMTLAASVLMVSLFLLSLSRLDKIVGAWRRAEIALHMPWRLIAVLLVPSGFVMGTLAGFLGSKFFFLFLPNVKDQDAGTVPLMAFGAIVGVFITVINVDTVWKLSRK